MLVEATRPLAGVPLPEDDGLILWTVVENSRRILLEKYTAVDGALNIVPRDKMIAELESRYGRAVVELVCKLDDKAPGAALQEACIALATKRAGL